MRMKDVASSGQPEIFEENLLRQVGRLRSVGRQLYQRSDLNEGCRVYPAIADATAAQLEMLSRLYSEPIEVTANICRTIFEINIVFRYCLLSPQNLVGFTFQSAYDEISIYKSYRKLANEESDPRALQEVDRHIQHIKGILDRHGATRPEQTSVRQMAVAVDLQNEYDALYGVYCKYVHASAWLVLRQRDHIDLPVFRHTMQLNSQVYAGDTLKRLEDIIDIHPPSRAN